MSLRAEPEPFNHPVNPLERLRRGEYYPVGLPPRQQDVNDPYSKTMDVVHLIQALQLQLGETFLVVAHPPSNILDRLRRVEAKKSNPRAEAFLMIEANERSRAIALKDQILYESIQDELSGPRVPVVLMSDLTVGPEFEALLRMIRSMCSQDQEFAEAVYATVPHSFRPRAHRTKTLAQLRELSGGSFQKAHGKMDYVLTQIAEVLFLNGRKLGHSGEQGYNQVTVMAAQRLGLVSPAFQTIEISSAEGSNPYRAIRQGVRGNFERALSANLSLKILKDQGIDLDGLDLLGNLQMIQASEAQRAEEYPKLQDHSEFIMRLYSRMLERAEGRPKVQEAIALQYAEEIVLTLTNGTEPVYKFLFEETGVLDVIAGKLDLEDFADRTNFLPIKCPQRKDESASAHFVRFVDDLLHGGGPVIPRMKRTGVQYRLCEALNDLVPETNEAAWEVPYSIFHRMMFTMPPVIENGEMVGADELTDKRWKALAEFIATIKAGGQPKPSPFLQKGIADYF
jgi:hypothetical protein